MKRIFAILSVLALLACCITPAFASDFYDSTLINYFDYSNIEVNYTLTQANNSIDFPLFREEYIRYVDLLIFCNESYGLSKVTLNRNLLSNDLTMVSLGSGYYRLYGQFSGGSSAYTDNPSLSFTFSSSSAYVQILSFKYSNFVIQRFKEVARMGVLGTDHPAAISMPDANTPLYFHENADYDQFQGSIYLDNWRKYDYIDVLLRVDSVGLTSVYVDIAGIKIPFDLNFFDSSFGAISFVHRDIWDTGDISYTFLANEDNIEFVSVRIDLSTVAKSFSEVPIIHFYGLWSRSLGTQGIIRLESVTGVYSVENASALGVWFSNLKEFLSDLFNPNDSTSNQIDTSIHENESIDQEISDGISDVGEDLGDIDVGTNITEIGADPSHFISFFTILFNNYYILRIFWIAALMMILGYIFHGQR